MKTIAIFSGYYFPHLGGVERYTYNLATQLNKMGYKIIIITSKYNKNLKNKEKIGNLTIYRIPTYSILSNRYPIIKSHCCKKIFKELKKENIDFAIVQTRFWTLSYIASKFIRKNKIRSFLIEHGSAHFTVNNRFLDFCGAIYEHILTNLIKKNIKNYYGVSYKCVEWLKHFKINAKGVLYNSIDISKINKFDKIQKNNEIINISFVGRLIEEKGVLKLINSFKMLQKKYNNIILNIAGDGPILNKIIDENKENDKINVMGKLEHNDVLNLLAKTSIFVNPSDFPEGLPTTILEAGLFKCAIIATPMGGTKEVISDDTLGVISSSDENSLYNNINLLLQNREKMNEMGININKKICKEFSWESTANKVKNIIENE